MTLDGKTYSDGEVLMMFRAVKRILIADDHDLWDAERALLNTALHIGLVAEDERIMGG